MTYNSTDAGEPGQTTSGLRAVLSLAPVYRFSQRLLGAARPRQFLVDEVLRPTHDDRVLDLGCGTADILDHLPELDYVGFDPSMRYVRDADRRHPGKGRFTSDHTEIARITDRTIVLAIGVLHHMSDEEAADLLRMARSALEPDGKFISMDPTLLDGQPRLASALIKRDRGRFVRSPEAITELCESVFTTVERQVRHDLIRVPYSHVIVIARP